MSAFDDQVDELMAVYRKQVARSAELRGKISEIAATVTAPREAVKVTVGAHGEVRALEFPTGAYKRMAPAELAEVLLTAITAAKEKAQAAFSELMASQQPGGLNVADLIAGKVDLAAAWPAGPPMSDAVREYLKNGVPRERTG